uniref:Myb/SANT-like domain-containing protein n=1 Tax=Chenopodium quinoa TaxID=63459 RepID=A0A803KM48_CHEQI
MGEEGSNRGRGTNKRFWTFEEDTVLIKYLHELSLDPKWKSESGFKSGYMNKLEEMIKSVLPNCGLKADPHIESRIKHWTEKYSAMAEMLSTSGFGWDSDKKMLQVEKIVFDEWVKVDDANELVASLHNTSKTFGKIFEDINANLGTMANSWSKAEEREQKMDDEVNKVLEEVMKLDGVSLRNL